MSNECAHSKDGRLLTNKVEGAIIFAQQLERLPEYRVSDRDYYINLLDDAMSNHPKVTEVHLKDYPTAVEIVKQRLKQQKDKSGAGHA